MKGIPTMPLQRPVRSLLSAFTLVEVMVSMLIFAMSAIGLSSLFLQNMRFSAWQINNVHITNTSFSISDQIKNMGANQIYAAFQAPAATPTPLNVTLVDPSDLNDGYKTVSLYINKKEVAETSGVTTTIKSSTEVRSTWNNVTLKISSLPTSPVLPVSYYITVRRNVSAPNSTPAFDVLEVTIAFRWSVSGSSLNTINQIQLAFPAPNCSF
jgi:Tfp pilus assembly protein PilV